MPTQLMILKVTSRKGMQRLNKDLFLIQLIK